jgi:hypothetical protein
MSETNVSSSFTSKPAVVESPINKKKGRSLQVAAALFLSPSGPIETSAENESRKPPNLPEKFGLLLWPAVRSAMKKLENPLKFRVLVTTASVNIQKPSVMSSVANSGARKAGRLFL